MGSKGLKSVHPLCFRKVWYVPQKVAVASQTHLTNLTWEDKASGFLEVSQGFFALKTAVGAVHLFSFLCLVISMLPMVVLIFCFWIMLLFHDRHIFLISIFRSLRIGFLLLACALWCVSWGSPRQTMLAHEGSKRTHVYVAVSSELWLGTWDPHDPAKLASGLSS